MQILIEYFKDATINTIDRDMVIQFKTDLWKLPPNMNRSKKFKDKNILEVIALEPKLTISETDCLRLLWLGKVIIGIC